MKISIKKSENSKRVDFTVDGYPYHTNPEGEGLWDGGDYMKQIKGTCQFALKQKTLSGMRKAIEKEFREVV